MGKLNFLNRLEIMINTGEIAPEEGKEEGILLLQEMKDSVKRQLVTEIWNDITDCDMAYYAPEHPDWQHYLDWLNGGEDYSAVLHETYTNEILEELWQNSHISEVISENSIKKEMALQIGQLKMLALLDRIGAKPCNPQKMESMVRSIKARIKGLYNILYEE